MAQKPKELTVTVVVVSAGMELYSGRSGGGATATKSSAKR